MLFSALYGTAAGYTILAFLNPEQKALAVVVVVATLTLLGFIYSGFMVRCNTQNGNTAAPKE